MLVGISHYLDQRLESHQAPSLVGCVLLYISTPSDLLQNLSSSSTILFSPRHPPLPYSTSPSDSGYSPPVSSPPSAASCPSLIPMISRASCSHHLLDGHIHGFRSAAKHNSVIVRFEMHCAAVFWRREVYTPISPSPTIFSSAPMVGYTPVPSRWRLRSMPAILRAARWWNPSRDLSNRGFNNHVLDPKRITACTTATYNLPALILSAPSLPKIFANLPHFPCAVWRFRSTAGQSLSVNSNVFLKYRNKDTVVISFPYSEKTHPICSSVSSTRNLSPFLFVPCQNIAEVGCDRLRASCGKTCPTGGIGGGVDSPPPGWLFCPEGVGNKSLPVGFSVRTLFLGIPPQVTSIGPG